MAAEETASKKSKKGLIAGLICAAVFIVAIVVYLLVFAKPAVVGKYNISAFIKDGEESTEMVDFLKALGGKYTIEFKKDKTGVLEMSAGDTTETVDFKWNDKKIIVEEDGETDETDYEYKDNTVTVSIEGQGMKFTRE